MKVSAHYAETHFAEVLATARRGESVEIAEPEMPTLKLVIWNPASPEATAVRVPGTLAGKLGLPKDWATTDEMSRLMVDSPLTTDGDI